MALAAALAATLAQPVAGVAHAQQRAVTVVNKATAAMTELYISPSSSDDWEEDVLDGDVVAPGASLTVALVGYGSKTCLFDALAVYSTGAKDELDEVDLCAASTITFGNAAGQPRSAPAQPTARPAAAQPTPRPAAPPAARPAAPSAAASQPAAQPSTSAPPVAQLPAATPAEPAVPADRVPVQPAAPVMAWYYPQFARNPAQDAANMQRAGIDTVIVSQTGYEVGRPLQAAPIVEALRGTDMTFTVGIETNVVYTSQQHMIGELKRLVNEETTSPRWLRYGGKPVIVFWALPTVPLAGGQTPQQAWESIRAQVDPDRNTIWIGEGGDVTPNTGTMTYMPTFDGLHLYSVAWDEQPGRALQGWERRVRSAPGGKLWVATVMPGGHYGAGIVGSDQWDYRDRQNGAYLTNAWQGAIATKASMVILTSWNEERERTGIYPESVDAGADPGLYLDINRRFGDQWRTSVGAAPYASSGTGEG